MREGGTGIGSYRPRNVVLRPDPRNLANALECLGKTDDAPAEAGARREIGERRECWSGGASPGEEHAPADEHEAAADHGEADEVRAGHRQRIVTGDRGALDVFVRRAAWW